MANSEELRKRAEAADVAGATEMAEALRNEADDLENPPSDEKSRRNVPKGDKSE